MRRVAVIGSGISGLGVAHGLAGDARVTLFEAGRHFGGHAHTVDLTLDGTTHGVDCGFLVYNERTYPRLIALFDRLGVASAPSEMSFSVQVPAEGLEWSGRNLDAVFAQRGNLLRPDFWRMLADLRRFNAVCTATALAWGAGAGNAALAQSLGAFLDDQRFSAPFRDWYLLPMLGCIWSCPTSQMLAFPVATMIRFCHNHGLIQLTGRPQWRTVRGGARQYVAKMLERVDDARLASPVRRVRRAQTAGSGAAGVQVSTDAGTEHYDDVVLACHSDQALALLADPTADEAGTLGSIAYHRNRAVLHSDVRLLPRRRRAWAAWNYERAAADDREGAAVCLHYLIDRLQPLPFATPVIVSLNPVRAPREESVHARFDYAHPVFDAAAIAAQQQVPALQGRANTWYCGAWTRYGFHEDGLASAEAVCSAWRARWRRSTVAADVATA